MSKQYKLTLSEAQAKVVAKACEFYARIGYGQYREILWNFLDWKADDAHERSEEAEKLLYEARAKVYPELGAHIGTSYGIGHFDHMDRAYDVYQVLRYAFEKEDDKLPFRHEPFTLLNEAFAKCEVES